MARASGHEQRFTMMVTLQRAKLVEERHSDLVAALVKAIAHYSGGQSAIAGAYEEDLSTSLGMRFVFSDRSSRDLFWRRLLQYCDQITQDALAVSPIGTLDENDTVPQRVKAPEDRGRSDCLTARRMD